MSTSQQHVAAITPSTEEVYSRIYATQQDEADPLAHLKEEFLIPSKAQLQSKTLPISAGKDESDPSIYLCGNSLGLQPKRTSIRIQQYLSTWATQGVFGHFKPLEGSTLPTWLDVDDEAAHRIAPIVGAERSEVAVMQTLTANLHFLMAKFYTPTKEKRKIIIEGKAFPSDHYAVESQIAYHGGDPKDLMVTIAPPSTDSPLLTTQHILATIDHHASDTALILLPGIQFYTGQLLDIPTITAHAHKHQIPIIWDLAHAVGNVPLHLHDWNVDAAAWCSYKYLNAGPGSIGGLFLHANNTSSSTYNHSLAGWWGSSKPTRFAMTNNFDPSPGASSLQLSNPSVFDITSLNASLELFALAGGMPSLRTKSLALTSYLETLLRNLHNTHPDFHILTSSNPAERGAQLSVRLSPGLLDKVMQELEIRGVVIDERKPDVIRVAPAPLYNGWVDVWEFVKAFGEALSVSVEAGSGAKGSSELLQTT